MGTRHLTVIKHDNQIKLAQYGQWDGYPSGQGLNILKFIRNECKPNKENIPLAGYDRSKMIAGLAHVKDITDAEHIAIFKQLRIKVEDDGSAWLSLEEAKRYRMAYPALSRDTGSDILKLVQAAQDTLLVDNALNFGKDNLMCEFVWVLNLDLDEVQMYHNYPGECIAKYDTNNPPTEAEFLAAFEEKEEEDGL